MSIPSHAGSAKGDATLLGEGEPSPLPDRPALETGVRVARYVLLDPLGHGAMGRVYKAYDPELDRRVALKVMASSAAGEKRRDRFLREAKAMARIDHPNVITVHDAGVHEGWVWVAMALIDGPSLEGWLREERSEREVLDVMIGAGRGLEAAHRAGVVHRDFKPANVLVGAGAVAKVGDFGLAGIEDPTTGKQRAPARVVGTPAYMSPEHVQGVGVDARSDQFSFTIALAEAVLGERPFTGSTLTALATSILDGDISPRVTHARGRLGRVIRRGLSKRPEDRFATMGELLDELERVRRRRWPTWGAVALGVAAIAGAYVLDHRGKDACESGAPRIEAFWDGAAPTIDGDAYTEEFIDDVRDRYVADVTAYASRWIEAYEDSCAEVGPRLEGGTLEQRHAAECLENRLASLQGLVAFTRETPLDAGRIVPLVEALPDIEDCGTKAWIPYPAEPERAAIAAELFQRVERLRLARLADASMGKLAEAREVERAARELGDPYMLTLALRERARVEHQHHERESVSAELDEALRIAAGAGHDRVAASVINDILIVDNEEELASHDLLRLASLGVAFAERTGALHLAGDLRLNESNLLRRLKDFPGALASLAEARRYYEEVGADKMLLRVRLSEVIALIDEGRLDEAVATVADMPSRATALYGENDVESFHAYSVLWLSLYAAGRVHEALEVGRETLARARTVYRLGAYTLRDAAWTVAVAAVRLGHVDEAEAAMMFVREPSPREPMLVASLDAWIDMTADRLPEAALVLDVALRGELTRSKDTLVAETQRAQVYLLLGEFADARDWLLRPALREEMAGAPDGSMVDYVIAAIIADVPPYEDKSWSELLALYQPDTVGMKWLHECALAMARGDESVADVQAVRDRFAQATFAGAPEVRVIDIWLAQRR